MNGGPGGSRGDRVEMVPDPCGGGRRDRLCVAAAQDDRSWSWVRCPSGVCVCTVSLLGHRAEPPRLQGRRGFTCPCRHIRRFLEVRSSEDSSKRGMAADPVPRSLEVRVSQRSGGRSSARCEARHRGSHMHQRVPRRHVVHAVKPAADPPPISRRGPTIAPCTGPLGREREVGLVTHEPHLVQQSLTCGHAVRAAESEQQPHRAAARTPQPRFQRLPRSRQGRRDVVRNVTRIAIGMNGFARSHAQHDRCGHHKHRSDEPGR